ncbi:MAG: nucleotidyltransferase domain-containing protein [Nanoarchaeota archaeon]
MKTQIKILREIYVNDGIHARAICRNLKLGMPSVKNSINKLSKLLTTEKTGRNIVYTIDYSKKDVIPYIYLIEYSRLNELPKKIQYAIFDYLHLLSNKPILTIIFGSYAKGDYTQDSDLDLLLVFNSIDKEAEPKAKVISMRHNITLAPVYLDYKSFSSRFFDQKKKFFQDLKKDKVIVNGIEWWVELKNEEA